MSVWATYFPLSAEGVRNNYQSLLRERANADVAILRYIELQHRDNDDWPAEGGIVDFNLYNIPYRFYAHYGIEKPAS